MRAFMDKDFLLSNPTACALYHNHAEKLPIIDFHCHLDPRMVAEDHRFSSITELWLGGDHYKWRALRANGVAERYITGDASDWDKFEKWAETVPYTLCNPLYHWTHLELRTAFGIDKLLNPKTAREIYDQCNEMLKRPEYSARGLMRRYHVEVICTTDDPVDSLQYHEQAAADKSFEIKMLPAWRPDKAVDIDKGDAFRAYISRLAAASDTDITSYAAFKDAMQKRHDFFAAHGCKLSDHGISKFYAEPFTDAQVSAVFEKALLGKDITAEEADTYKSAVLTFFAEMDADSGWVQQYHFGPMRNNNTKMFKAIGPDTGFDSIGESLTAESMSRFLDRLNSEGKLAKTILYNLNPCANEMTATMIGNFQDGSVPGKMQWGSGWWFLDQKDGIERQLNTLALQGLLSRFVGMLTDSRSFLSYPRHEYFRRILCNMLGTRVETGEIPAEEMKRVEQMVEDISYFNAKSYFNF